MQVTHALSRTGGAAMEIESGGVPVLVDIHIVGGGMSQTVYTRARASVVLADAPAFHVYPEGLLATLNKALGAEDVELGDPEFDGKFVVKCAAPQAVRGVWAKAVRDTMRTSLSDAEASSDGSTVNVRVVAAIDASGHVKGDVPPDLLPPRRDLARIGGAQLSIAGKALHLRFAPGRFPGPGPIEASLELFVALTRKPESAFR